MAPNLAFPPTPNPHFPPPSPRPGRGSFRPHFHCVPLQKKGDFLTENSLFRDQGKWRFLDPETLLSRKWGFRACLGSGESQPKTGLLAGSALPHGWGVFDTLRMITEPNVIIFDIFSVRELCNGRIELF